MPTMNPWNNYQYNNYIVPGSNVEMMCFVNGYEGAQNFMVTPGQRVFLMDSNSCRFWVKQCNTTGQVTMTGYTFTEEVAEQNPMSSLEARIKALEDKLNGESSV